ncbi:hypothetical protein [Empedobacter brevis]|uniref:hypothetical protein n=1 Tax=Empedobacter brevis TaxID=247 RepID=UPI0028A86E1B|nr:hypothetical protein [Empedobacter brevis]
MKTINNELQQLATIMEKNLTATIIELHNIGFDFNKSVGEQDGEVDEKVSQMLLNSLIPTDEEEEVKVTEEHVEKPLLEEKEKKQETIENFTRKYNWMTDYIGKNNINKALTQNKIRKIKDEMLKYCFLQPSSTIKYEYEHEKINMPSNKKDKDKYDNDFEKIFEKIYESKVMTEDDIQKIKNIGNTYITSYAEKIEKKINK